MVEKSEQNLEVIETTQEMREKEVVDQRQKSRQTNPIARTLSCTDTGLTPAAPCSRIGKRSIISFSAPHKPYNVRIDPHKTVLREPIV